MYKVAFLVSTGELVAYPWMNLQTLFAGHHLFEFVIFQQEHCSRLFAEMQLNSFDGVIFSSNVTNDTRIHDLILANKPIINEYISKGKGVLILLQYHLAKKDCAFNIISNELFNNINNDIYVKSEERKEFYSISHLNECGDIVMREQNAVVLTNGKFDSQKVYFDNKSIILSYPNRITAKEIFEQSQNSQYVKSFAPAYISYYPHAYFTAPFCLRSINQSGVEFATHKPLIIYSTNENKRVIITTIPADLQEHKKLLENMISYITRGRPDAVLWKDSSCTSCHENCDTKDYLNKARVHYFETSEQDFLENIDIINQAKYVIACGETAFVSCRNHANNIVLPIKTPLCNVLSYNSYEKDKRIILDVPTISQIELWANQGFDYLLNRFPQNDRLDNKWDSLYATRQVVLLANDIHRIIPNYIVEQIERYLNTHNQDNESFDKVDRATYAAADVCELLNIKLNFKKKLNIVSESIPRITDNNIETSSLFDLAQYVLLSEKIEKIPEIYQIIARFVSERNFEQASWEDDIMTTATVLRAMVRIDNCPLLNTSITNIVCSCYQNVDCPELTSTLSTSIEQARQSEYELRLNYEKKCSEYQQKYKKDMAEIKNRDKKIYCMSLDIEKQKNTILEYNDLNNSLKNKNSRLSAWLITMCGLLIYFFALFISFVITAKNINQMNYIKEINDFFISWGIGGSIIAVFTIIVTIKLFKVLYARDIKKQKKFKG